MSISQTSLSRLQYIFYSELREGTPAERVNVTWLRDPSYRYIKTDNLSPLTCLVCDYYPVWLVSRQIVSRPWWRPSSPVCSPFVGDDVVPAGPADVSRSPLLPLVSGAGLSASVCHLCPSEMSPSTVIDTSPAPSNYSESLASDLSSQQTYKGSEKITDPRMTSSVSYYGHGDAGG